MTRAEDATIICLLASMLKDAGIVACGSSSPLQSAAALLAEEIDPDGTRALIFRNNIEDPFHESGSELYDRIGQGRIDVFFLSGAQIDGQANLNNVGIGAYPGTKTRFPGSFGTPFIVLMVPRVILYREEHSPRVLVERVDFISAAGTTPPGVHRRGGISDLITSRARFTFDSATARFALASAHPGHSPTEIVAATGFDFDLPETVPETAAPPAAWLDLLYGPVRARLAQTYPEFARERL